MIIAIGTRRPPKVNAVKAGFERICTHFELSGDEIVYRLEKVESGVSNTPRSISEMMSGAQKRVEHLEAICANGPRPDFFIGLEGGLFTTNATFLQSWVYARKEGVGFWGSSPAIQVPDSLLPHLDDPELELADLIDQVSQQSGVRNRGGACAVFTAGLLTRQAIFESAVLAALAPFYNTRLYVPS